MSGGHARLAGELLEAVHPEHQPAVPPFRDLDLIDGAPEAPVVGLRPRQRLEGRIREPDSLGLPRGTRQVAGVGRSSTGRAARSSTVQRRHRHRWCRRPHPSRVPPAPRTTSGCARRSPSASDDTSPIGPDQVARREDGRLPMTVTGNPARCRPLVDEAAWVDDATARTPRSRGGRLERLHDAGDRRPIRRALGFTVWFATTRTRRSYGSRARGSALTEHRGSTRDRDRDLRLHRARGCRAGRLPRGDRRPVEAADLDRMMATFSGRSVARGRAVDRGRRQR